MLFMIRPAVSAPGRAAVCPPLIRSLRSVNSLPDSSKASRSKTARITSISWDRRKRPISEKAMERASSFGKPQVPAEISGKAALSHLRLCARAREWA